MSLSRYVTKLEQQALSAGEIVCRRGEPGSTMYVVVDGELEVDYGSGIPVRLGPGESFGEMALIDKATRSATVTAVGDAVVVPLSRGVFLTLVQETPYFALEVMQSLTARLRTANEIASDGS